MRTQISLQSPDGRSNPFRWDIVRRAELRAELSSIYAQLYGLTKEELKYILTTFPVQKNNEGRLFGEYQPERLNMETWGRMEASK